MSKMDIPSAQNKYDIDLPQSIIESFARFLVPEIRKYYHSEQGQKEFDQWEAKQNKLKRQNRRIIKSANKTKCKAPKKHLAVLHFI